VSNAIVAHGFSVQNKVMLCGKIQNEIKKLNDDNNDYQQCKVNQSTKGDGTVLDSTSSDSSQKPITI